jgi:hypothetical protein
MPPAALLAALDDAALPGKLRAHLLDLLVVTQVDVAPLEDQVANARALVRVWEAVTPETCEFALTAADELATDAMTSLKRYLLTFLSAEGAMDPRDRDANLAVVSAVRAVKELARFGLLAQAEFAQWLEVLTPVLDGADDKLPAVSDAYVKRFGPYTRFVYDEDSHLMCVSRILAIDVVEVLCAFYYASAVSRLLLVFHEDELARRAAAAAGAPAPPPLSVPHIATLINFRCDGMLNKASRQLRINRLFHERGYLTDDDTAGDFLASRRVKPVDNGELALANLRELLYVLMDTTRYHYRPLVVRALSLFTSVANVHTGIVAQMRAVQLIPSAESLGFFDEVKPLMQHIRRHADRPIPKAELGEVTRSVKKLTKRLMARSAENNALIKTMGASITIARIVSYISAPDIKGLSASHYSLLTACYRTLLELTMGDAVAAWDVFPQMAHFAKHLVLNVGAPEVLRNMLESDAVCANLTDAIIRDMVFALPATAFDPTVALVLKMLVDHDSPETVQRNQPPVLKALLDAEETSPGVIRCRDFMSGRDGRRVRDKLIAEGEYRKGNSKIMYHLIMTSVVTSCVRNRDAAVRHAVRLALFNSSSMDDVFEVMCNAAVPYFYRGAYIRLFTALYAPDRALRAAIWEHRKLRKFLECVLQDLMTLEAMLSDPGSVVLPGTVTVPPLGAAPPDAGLTGSGTQSTPSTPGLAPGGPSPLLSSESFLFFAYTALVPALRALLEHVFRDDVGATEETSGNPHEYDIRDTCAAIAAECASVMMKVVEVYPEIPMAPDAAAPPPPLDDYAAASDASSVDGEHPFGVHASRYGSIAGSPDSGDAGKSLQQRPSFAGMGAARGSMRGRRRRSTRIESSIDPVLMAKAATLHSEFPLPLKLRSAVDFYLTRDDELGRIATVIDTPVCYLQGLAAVLELFDANEFVVNDDEVRATAGRVRRFTQPPPPTVSQDATSEGVKLFQAWARFCDRVEAQCAGTKDETAFEAAAVCVLRMGSRGRDGVRGIVRVIDEPSMPPPLRVALLNFLRLTVSVADSPYTDASLLITTEEFDSAFDNDDLGSLDQIGPLHIKMSANERCMTFASWPNDYLLSPKIMAMLEVPSEDSLRANLACVNTLLGDGNLRVQTNIHACLRDTPNAPLLPLIRRHMQHCREQLRERGKVIRRELPAFGDAPPAGGAPVLIPDDLHARLEERYDFTLAIHFLLFAKLLCEGHFADMQNFFREQPDSQVTINVIEALTGLFEVLVHHIDAGTFALTVQLIETLTELLQGPCFANQVFVVSQNIGDALGHAITQAHPDLDGAQQFAVQTSASTLLLALLEGHMDLPLLAMLMGSMSLRPYVAVVDATYVAWAAETDLTTEEDAVLAQTASATRHFLRDLFVGSADGQEHCDRLSLAINLFIFLKTVLDIELMLLPRGDPNDADYIETFVDRDRRTCKELFRLSHTYHHISPKVATIEIARHGGVETVYFRVPTIDIYNLREASRDKIIDEVDRTGDGTRIHDFFTRCLALMREIEFYDELRRTKVLSVIHNLNEPLLWFAMLVAFAINVFLLATVKSENETENERNHVRMGAEESAYQALSATHIVTQVFLFINMALGPLRIEVAEQWHSWQEALDQKAVQTSKRGLSINPPRFRRNAVGELSFFSWAGKTLGFIVAFEPMYQRLFFMLVAIVGFYNSPLWQGLALVQIISRSPLLQNVVESVTRNWRSLLLTIMLLFIVMYIFALIAYFNLSEFYNEESFGHGGHCDELLRCTVITLVYGLKSGGGVAELLSPPIFGKQRTGAAYARLVYDLLFFVLFIIMFLNLIFGIILDTFGQLRVQRDMIEQDQTKKCFICGLSVAEFDRVALGGFEPHVGFEQTMWNYQFFMHHVKRKPAMDHTGIEGFVWECMQTREALFFPVGKAKVLLVRDAAVAAVEAGERAAHEATAAAKAAEEAAPAESLSIVATTSLRSFDDADDDEDKVDHTCKLCGK